mmetsp:Transcript_15297/g.33748  ORF Transcript_15297/g.33748 Transcript_15297/m.33748 type:complete len:212 (+) Transcript_15297:1917-2552(+)
METTAVSRACAWCCKAAPAATPRSRRHRDITPHAPCLTLGSRSCNAFRTAVQTVSHAACLTIASMAAFTGVRMVLFDSLSLVRSGSITVLAKLENPLPMRSTIAWRAWAALATTRACVSERKMCPSISNTWVHSTPLRSVLWASHNCCNFMISDRLSDHECMLGTEAAQSAGSCATTSTACDTEWNTPAFGRNPVVLGSGQRVVGAGGRAC